LADWAIHAFGQIRVIDGIQTMLARKAIFALLFPLLILKLPRNAIHAFGSTCDGHDFAGTAIVA